MHKIARVALLFSTALLVFAAPRDRIAGPIRTDRTTVLRGNIHPLALVAADQGALADSEPIANMRVLLKPSDDQTAALEQFLEQQRDPSSANYQQWLSPEEFGSRFGASAGDLAALSAWLTAEGFTVDQVARAGNWIAFSGTAGQVARTFHTRLHHYALDGETHFANATDPAIPSALDGVIAMVQGLDDFRPAPQKIRQLPAYTSGSGAHYLAPDDIATVYDVAPLFTAGFDGTGQKIVIAGQTDVNLADLQGFRSKFGLVARDPQLVLFGKDPGTVSGDATEATLDLEWSGAVARNASLVYVYSTNVFTSVQYAIDQNLAPVISVSYGACESSSQSAYRSLAQQANAQGITWLNSSGDSGAAGCDFNVKTATHGPSVSFPANIPEVTAVGGTEFNETGNTGWGSQNTTTLASANGYLPEKAWNDTAVSGSLSASGGGVSKVFAKPSWQTGTGVPADGARDVPDISLTASAQHDGYLMYINGGLSIVGGTSVSSPAFAGIVSILNQYLVAKGIQAKAGVGNINPTLYRLASTATSVFHDITVGDNIVPCKTGGTGCTTGSYGYSAGVGYDLVTGLGSVDAYQLVTNWFTQSSAVGTTTSVVSSLSSIAQTTSAVLTATVSPVTGTSVPAGTVAFSVNGTSLGTSTVSNKVATLTVKGSSLAVGSNLISATFVPAGNFGGSTGTVTVTVTAPPNVSTSTTLSANPATIASSASTQLTATVKAATGSTAPTGSISFSVGSTVLGTGSLSGGVVTLSVKGTSLTTGANVVQATYVPTGSFAASSGTATVTVTAAAGASNVLVSAAIAAGSQRNGLPVTLQLQETAGVATTITGFSLGGSNYSSLILSLFGTNKLAARGTLSTTVPVQGTLPATLTFTFSGVDADGQQWLKTALLSTGNAVTGR